MYNNSSLLNLNNLITGNTMPKKIFLLLIAILMVSGNIIPQKAVEVLSPTVTANVVTDLVVLDKTTAIATGTLGSVMKTTDAGLTWQTLKSGEDIWYNSLSVVGTQNIWVTGPNEFVTSSTDGGKSWKSQKVGKIGYFYKVQFFDENNGLVAGAAIISETQVEAIYQLFVTSDGGKTWKEKNASLGFFPMEMYFTTKNDGFAIVKNDEKTGKDRFVKTVDGGKTWVDVKELDNAILSTMSFPDSKNGSIIAEMPVSKGEKPTSKLVLFRTNDGGKSWKQETLPIDVVANLNKESHTIYFKDTKTGWIIKANESDGGVQNQVFRTDDGGKNWKKVYTSDESGVNKIAFFDDNTGILLPGYWYMQPKIFRTIDGGATFTQLVKGTENHFHSFQFLDEKTGFGVGENSIIKTNDGGKAWKVVKKVEGTMFDRLKFFNAKDGISVGYDDTGVSYLYSTNDGGETWSGYKLGYGGYLQNIFFTDMNTIYGLTFDQNNRSVMKSEDAGKSWKEVLIDTSPDGQFFDLFFLDKSNGWITGVELLPGATKNNGMVSYIKSTTDGGTSWSQTYLDDQTYPSNIQFLDKKHGWYTSSFNDTSFTLWRTTNGGEKWESSVLSSAQDITEGLQFQDAMNGWMLKAYGAPLSPSFIYRTKDGGKTWSLYNTVNKIEKLQFLDNKTVIGGGYSNLIKFKID